MYHAIQLTMNVRTLVLLLITLFVSVVAGAHPRRCPSPAEYCAVVQQQPKPDYHSLAQKITARSENDYERVRAIYKWICDSIDLDLQGRIYDAATCLERRVGMPEAYCRLYLELARCAGIHNVRIIDGKAKDIDGEIDERGFHYWLCVTLDNGRNILLDPVRGSGFIFHNQFVHNHYVWSWFDVDPEFMIFSHLPENPDDQFLERPLSEAEFRRLPYAPVELVIYNFDIHAQLELALAGELHLPKFFHSSADLIAPNLELRTIPHFESLSVGRSYSFVVQMDSVEKYDLALVDNGRYYTKLGEWRDEGGGVYSIDHVVSDASKLYLSFSERGSKSWTTLLEYGVAEPTDEDWARLAEQRPLRHPKVRDTKNLKASTWASMGLDNHALGSIIRENSILELPVVFKGCKDHLKIRTIPMNYRLKVGEEYHFSISSKSGYSWTIALVSPDGRVDYPCGKIIAADDGVIDIDVVPTYPCELYLCYSESDDGEFRQGIKYVVN